MNTKDTIQSKLTSACEAVLPSTLTNSGAEPGEQLLIAAIIGFTGDRVRGSLAVATGSAGLQRVRDSLGASEEQAADSLGEMANLVAGHLKRSLTDLGEVIAITPPIVVRGVTIEVCGSGDVCRAEDARTSGDGSVVTWLDYEPSPDLVLEESGDNQSISDGEILLF